MIDIRIDGTPVDLTPGTRLTLEAFNPLLDMTTVQGARVYGFSLPDTPKNRRVLGFFNQAQIPYQNRKFYCEKYCGGQLIERGWVMIADAPAGSYNLYFTQNLGEIFGDLQGRLLSDIDFGTVALPAVISPEWAGTCFPTIENPGFYGNQAVGGFGGLVNRYQNGQYDPAARVPLVKLTWLMDAFGELTGWQFGGAFRQDPDLAQLLLYNLFSLDGAAGLTYRNHLPDLTFGALVLGLRQVFNLYLDFDVRRKTLTLDFGRDILTADCKRDWSDKVVPDHTKVPDLANRLELGYAIDGNDALMKPIPAPFDVYTTPETPTTAGGSVTPIRSVFSTLQTNGASGLAMTSQPGVSPFNKDSAGRTTPKLLFWNGLNGAGVPVASNTRNGKALVWHGPGNLVDGYWREFERFKAGTFLIKKMAALTPADLATFHFRQKVHIRGVNYLVGNYKAVLGVDENVIPTELSLWKV